MNPGVAVPVPAPRPRSRVGGWLEFMRRLMSRPDGLIGVVILVIFTVLALFPNLFVGPLETAITATGPRLSPPIPGYPLGTDELGVVGSAEDSALADEDCLATEGGEHLHVRTITLAREG